MYLMKILVSWLAKYFQLVLAKLVFAKIRSKSLSKLFIKTEAQCERIACNIVKLGVTIIFHNKAEVTQQTYAVTISEYSICENFFGLK